MGWVTIAVVIARPRTSDAATMSSDANPANSSRSPALQSEGPRITSWSAFENGRPKMTEVPGSEKIWPTQLVTLAMGFLGPEHYVNETFGIELDPRSNFKADHGVFTTGDPKIFAAGDCRRGQSLVVWAINEGRGAARAIDQALMGRSELPAPGVTMGTALV